jgi:hypothetical protein
MGTKSVTSFGERAVGIAEVPDGCTIDRTTPRGLRQRWGHGARLVVIACGDDDDSVDPDLETAIFDAP